MSDESRRNSTPCHPIYTKVYIVIAKIPPFRSTHLMSEIAL